MKHAHPTAGAFAHITPDMCPEKARPHMDLALAKAEQQLAGETKRARDLEARIAKCVAEITSPRTPTIMDAIEGSLARMIEAQMTAYPDHWSDADKRAEAERTIFTTRGEA